MSASLADYCAVALSDAFVGDGEILASPMGWMPALGARLAASTHAPDLALSDGEALLLDGVPPLGDEAGWPWAAPLPYRSVFHAVWSGRRHVIMGASQIDAFGDQNIARVGPHDRPVRELIGTRGAPGNTINHAVTYWVADHNPRVFVEAVDVVCGVGTARARALGAGGRFHDLRRVVTNLGVLSPDPSGRLVVRSVHPGVDPALIVERTGFSLTLPDAIPWTREPTADELVILRRLDPRGLAARELPR